MNVSLITPAAKRTRSGNRATAVRWASLLRELGHRVTLESEWSSGAGRGPDLMVAIHAYRSAQSVARFHDRFPQRPLVVLLAGTDIYRFAHTDPQITLSSLAKATHLVGLHDCVAHDIPAEFTARLRVIHQSAAPLGWSRMPSQRHFDVCVVGHLREEKDPLRAAQAARALPPGSKLRVLHLGKAHTDDWARRAQAEMVSNPRYLWKGEVSGHAVRRMLGRARAMVMSSVMEGGANVVSEAVMAGLPVIASDISGNIGLLGRDYSGYYPVSDTAALAAVLARAERDPTFLNALADHAAKRRSRFERSTERAAWKRLLDAL